MPLRSIPDKYRSKLWPHQREAVDFAIQALSGSLRTCILRMPTGTGKTGVIASLTMLAHAGSAIVLTPWTHLRTQIIRDLRDRFWSSVVELPCPSDHRVQRILPSSAASDVEEAQPFILVGTFTTLNEIRREYQLVYQKLASVIDLVIVDEGHYEPAVEWGRSVKGLEKQTVILTATPYRNDLRLFRITDPDKAVYHFTHEKAERNTIRRVAFEQLPASGDHQNDWYRAFARFWSKAKASYRLPSKQPRAIICCANSAQIQRCVESLRRDGVDAIGIHERFANGKKRKSHFRSSVPGTQETAAEVWVHQHKLTEGLDDHRFCVLALFTEVRNDRKLVQQIGRILRRDEDDRKKPALVIYPTLQLNPEEGWLAYRSFEKEFQLLDQEHFREVVERLLAIQPPVEYFGGRFRRRFDHSLIGGGPSVIVPPSVLVHRASKSFALGQYIDECTDTLNLEDAVILGPDINGPCRRSDSAALWVYASVGNSRLLSRESLYEVRLETHCVVIARGFVFISDTCGHYPVEYLDEHTAPLDISTLGRYLDNSFRPTEVATVTTIPYDNVIRGSRVYGHNLRQVPAALTDRIQICQAARGSAPKLGRRYVGFKRGRLRDELPEVRREVHDYHEFVHWVERVAGVLDSSHATNAVFDRYMSTCPPPADVDPKTLSFDLQRDGAVLHQIDGTPVELQRASVSVEAGDDEDEFRGVSLTFERPDGKTITTRLRLEYQAKKRRFWFRHSEGESIAVDVDEPGQKTRSLPDYLNMNQDTLIIGLAGGEVVYQGRQFYSVDYAHAERALLELIISSETECRSEKGSKEEIGALKSCGGDKLPDGSLFRLIADNKLELPFEPSVLICDDLGSECADFVAADTEGRHLAFIHAKVGTGSRISATAFHDVVAQAMKNLVFLAASPETPKRARSWTKRNHWNKTAVPIVQRCPADLGEGEKLWQALRSQIIESANPNLYVVLATAGMVDRQSLSNAIQDRAARTPETAKLLHLMDALNGHARQFGVRLMIYDLQLAGADGGVGRRHRANSRKTVRSG